MEDPTAPILTIQATSGSSKTSSLVEGTKRALAKYPHLKIRFLIFNTLPAQEAKSEFGHMALVSTLHVYAYHNTVKQYNLNPNIAGFLTWRDIPKHIKRPFGTDGIALGYVENYCTSSALNFVDFKTVLMDEGEFSPAAFKLAGSLLDEMANGKMRITHSFYLKFFHILVMNGTIKLQPMDKVYYDEFQDASGIALDILEKIPATQKVFVGDRNQRIYHFLRLEDGFLRYPDAKTLRLNKSFRVDASYAPQINRYMAHHLGSTAIFVGMEYPKDAVKTTKAYITRTNAALIAEMIRLNKVGTPYHLATKTKVKQMFKWPLAVIYAKPGHKQLDSELKHLQSEVDIWNKTKAITKLNLFEHLGEAELPPQVKQSISLIVGHGDIAERKKDIITASVEAGKHQKTQCALTLLTAFGSKGGTWDVVELDNDINKSVAKILAIPKKDRNDEDIAELKIGFVAVTRMRHELINCDFLP